MKWRHRHGAVSIYRSLFVDLLIGIALLGGAVFATSVFGVRTVVETLSSTLISQTADKVETELRRFFEPAVGALDVARQWGEAGLFGEAGPVELNKVFAPLMQRYSQVSSILHANERGNEWMLLRVGDRWFNRVTRRDDWGGRSKWLEWESFETDPKESWKDLDYDPRRRPWYRGAVARSEGGSAEVAWTAPYQFFTTKDPGITASTAYDTGDGHRYVMGFDMLLKDITQFTLGLSISDHGKAFVLTDDQRVIGLPRSKRFLDPAAAKAALLAAPSDIGVPEVEQAVGALLDRPNGDHSPRRLSIGTDSWWGSLRPFPLASDRSLLIGVIVPEADLLGSLVGIHWWILGVTALVLAAAAIRANQLAKRFSRPIEALVRESDRIRRGNLERGEPIETPVKEVRRLALAHDQMRDGLQSLMKLERDLQLARQIQQNTFPDSVPSLSGFEIEGWSEPAEETGGDTFDMVGLREERGKTTVVVTQADADRVVLLLADATGHGIGPALSVTQVRAMLRMAVRTGQPLARIVREMNEQLCADLTNGRFIAAWLGELRAADGALTSFSAGQAPLFRYNAAEDKVDVLGSDVPAFGIIEGMDIEIGAPIGMGVGDIFLVLSDGLLEAENSSREIFGSERAIDVILRCHDQRPKGILDALRDAVLDFTGSAPQKDDRTAVIVKRSHA